MFLLCNWRIYGWPISSQKVQFKTQKAQEAQKALEAHEADKDKQTEKAEKAEKTEKAKDEDSKDTSSFCQDFDDLEQKFNNSEAGASSSMGSMHNILQSSHQNTAKPEDEDVDPEAAKFTVTPEMDAAKGIRGRLTL